MVELKGSLAGIGLPAIVQLIGDLHHSGTLQLTNGETTGLLTFDNGRLVAATCGEDHGLQAVAHCATALADADFTFIELTPTVARTLDLGSSELKKLLSRLDDGYKVGDDTVPREQQSDRLEVEVEDEICPLLGFADDRARHYSRPTALHRCYATGVPGVVTSQEQRELCLTSQFANCPRFRQVEHIAVDEPGRVPPRVAARMANAGQLQMAPGGSRDDRLSIPGWIGHDDPPTILDEPAPASARPRRTPRSFLLVLTGAVLAILLVAVVIGVAVPAFNSGAAQKSSVAGGPALLPVATATRAALVAQPTTAAAGAVALTAPTARASGGPAPSPRAAATVAARVTLDPRALMDVRFSSGPGENWLDNPPFAAWSDGAYRFQAARAARFVAVGVPVNQVLDDFVVTATFRKTGGPPGGGYGLIVRDQGPEPRDGVNQDVSAYVFEAGDLGEFGVWRRDGDHWVDLVPWMHSDSIRPGGSPNDLMVRAIGNRFTFVVNGSEVASVQDDTYGAGGVALFVGGDYNEVALDHFSVQLPN